MQKLLRINQMIGILSIISSNQKKIIYIQIPQTFGSRGASKHREKVMNPHSFYEKLLLSSDRRQLISYTNILEKYPNNDYFEDRQYRDRMIRQRTICQRSIRPKWSPKGKVRIAQVRLVQVRLLYKKIKFLGELSCNQAIHLSPDNRLATPTTKNQDEVYLPIRLYSTKFNREKPLGKYSIHQSSSYR